MSPLRTVVSPAVPSPDEDPLGWAVTSRETGKVVLFQAPNLPAVLSTVGAVVTAVSPRGSAVQRGAAVATVLVSTWWGVDELARGVNPFRRALGAGGLAAVAAATVVGLRRR
ncbi:MAG: hypothetical protein ACJ715_01930 [Ornithinibacter sp.]